MPLTASIDPFEQCMQYKSINMTQATAIIQQPKVVSKTANLRRNCGIK